MRASEFVSLELSFAVRGTALAEELRFRQQLHTIADDVLRPAGLGYVQGVRQGGGRVDINAGVRRTALRQAWSALHDQLRAAGALDRLTVTAHDLGSARVLWPDPADEHTTPPTGAVTRQRLAWYRPRLPSSRHAARAERRLPRAAGPSSPH